MIIIARLLKDKYSETNLDILKDHRTLPSRLFLVGSLPFGGRIFQGHATPSD